MQLSAYTDNQAHICCEDTDLKFGIENQCTLNGIWV